MYFSKLFYALRTLIERTIPPREEEAKKKKENSKNDTTERRTPMRHYDLTFNVVASGVEWYVSRQGTTILTF